MIAQNPRCVREEKHFCVCLSSHASKRAEAACACHGATSLDALMLD